MAVKSTVKLNKFRIKQLDDATVRALEQTAALLHEEVEQAQVMPFDEGDLQGVKTSVDISESATGHVSIVTEGPYARRLYYHPEFNFQTGENPNAKGKWYEDWLQGGEQEDFAKNTFMELLKREADI